MATTTSPTSESLTVFEPTKMGLPPLGSYLQGVWDRRPLIWEMARTSLKADNYNTVLGQVWILLDPLLLAAVYLLLRTAIRPMGSPAERNDLIAHLIVGIFVFTFMRGCLMKGAKAVQSNKSLVLNAAFPRLVFPIEAVLEAFLGLLPTLAIYIPLHAVLGQPFGFEALLTFPVLLAILAVFGFGCACFFAPFCVFFKDTSSFLSYILRIWFFSTPILYTVEQISNLPNGIHAVLIWNPLYPSFAALEQIWNAEVPSPAYMAAATAWALVAFFVGVVVFLVRERDFAVRL